MPPGKRRSLADPKDNLEWIIKYCDSLESYMDYFGRSEEDLLDNEMYQDCCLSKINQIAQCLSRLRSKFPYGYERYFGPVVGGFHAMRDITVHQYENVDAVSFVRS